MSELIIATAAPAAPASKPAATTAPAPAAKQNTAATQAAVTTHTEQKPPQKANTAAPANPWLQMLPFILIFVVMIFFMNRSQKKQMQKRQEMMDKIAKGTKVLLTSGIYGTVDAVHDDAMTVEIASGVKIKVNKSGIAAIDAPADGEKKSGDK